MVARARRPFALENLKGVNDAPVLAYPSGDFAVIVSEYPPPKPSPNKLLSSMRELSANVFVP